MPTGRHGTRRLQERKAGQVIICHRGASAFAPENTLEAFAAAMDYGADAVEVDVQRTADGVLVCFHDSCLGRFTNGFGPVSWYTYPELLQVTLQHYGTATPETRIATFASLVELARHRALLIWLDIKAKGVEDDIAKILDSADAWDHIIGMESYNSENLQKNPNYKPVQCLKWLFDEGNIDWDPEQVKKLLPPPGKAIMVDDPRVAVHELGRPAYKPVSLPQSVYADWQMNEPSKDTRGGYLRMLDKETEGRSASAVLAYLDKRPLGRTQMTGSEDYQGLRAKHIVERTWAARRLVEMNCRSAEAVELLEYQVTHRTIHRDWDYHEQDGAAAAVALGMLGSIKSIPVLADTLKKVDPSIKSLLAPDQPEEAATWFDYPIKYGCVQALGVLRCEASKKALLDYLSLDETEAKKQGYVFAGEAAESLLKQDLSEDELLSLLKDSRSFIRAAALKHCLDHPSKECDEALKTAAPWALELPRAR